MLYLHIIIYECFISEILKSDINSIFVAEPSGCVHHQGDGASQHHMEEPRGQQSGQVDSVVEDHMEEDSPRMVDNRQLFEQKETVIGCLDKDTNELKVFESASG